MVLIKVKEAQAKAILKYYDMGCLLNRVSWF